MESFGERLRRRRVEKKLSQEALADMMQKSGKTVISSWETGKAEPSLADIRKLAEILETTASWLIDGFGESSTSQVPAGYVLMPAEEVIEMQRQLIKQQKAKLEEHK